MRSPGQAVVEFALIIMVLLTFMMGSVDLGRAYFDYDVLSHAVNEGVRRGSFDRNETNIEATTRAASGRLNLTDADVTVTCYNGVTTTTLTLCSLMTFNDVVEISATTSFVPITPLIGGLLPGGTLTLRASSRRTHQ